MSNNKSSITALRQILDKKAKDQKSDRWYTSWSDLTGDFIDRMPTGSLAVDYVLGGGSPRGRISQFYGAPGSGKTTIAAMIASSYQKQGIPVLYVDAENKFDPDFILRTTGFDVRDENTVLFSQEENAAYVFEMIQNAAENGFGLVIIDSSDALATPAQLSAEFNEAQMAQHARMYSDSLRKIKGICNRNKCELIFISQMRVRSNGYNLYEDASGANAIKFYSSIRNQFKAVEFIKDKDDNTIGLKSLMTNKKNSVGMPFRSAEITVYINSGIDTFSEVIDFAIMYNVIEKNGAWFTYSAFGDKPIQGKTGVIDWFKSHPSDFEDLRNKIQLAIKGSLSHAANDSIEDIETGVKISKPRRGKTDHENS